jgi:hypothetical protein
MKLSIDDRILNEPSQEQKLSLRQERLSKDLYLPNPDHFGIA